MMPLKPYMVAATFGETGRGMILLNAVCAPNPESAAAMAVFMFAREIGTEHLLTGINVQELRPEFLRTALNASSSEVVPLSVVSNKEPA